MISLVLAQNIVQLAGWLAIKVFDVKRASIDNLPPEAVDVALDIAKIPDPRTRKQVAEAVRVLLEKYFQLKRGGPGEERAGSRSD